MAFKEKLIGFLLIVIGALPFLTKIKGIGDILAKYTFLTPGNGAYQAVLIILGLFLIVSLKRRSKFENQVAR